MENLCDVRPQNDFEVILKTKRSEAATMVLKAGENTGGPDNRHHKSDQWMYVMEGEGEIIIEGETYKLRPQRLIVIEADKSHEVRNTGQVDLKTLNIYAPPEYS